MLAGWLPDFCTRLNIFLSYSSEYRALAESIAQSLKNDGHQVFFDKDSLPPGGDYNERIRKAIRSSDRFLFLASRSALESGKYTLTELDFARQRWPSPVGSSRSSPTCASSSPPRPRSPGCSRTCRSSGCATA